MPADPVPEPSRAAPPEFHPSGLNDERNACFFLARMIRFGRQRDALIGFQRGGCLRQDL